MSKPVEIEYLYLDGECLQKEPEQLSFEFQSDVTLSNGFSYRQVTQIDLTEPIWPEYGTGAGTRAGECDCGALKARTTHASWCSSE